MFRILLSLLVAGAPLFAATQITLSSSSNPSILGRPVALTATLPVVATGRVTFYDGVDVLGSAQISLGTATLTTVMLPAGARHLSALYPGDGITSPGSSNV